MSQTERKTQKSFMFGFSLAAVQLKAKITEAGEFVYSRVNKRGWVSTCDPLPKRWRQI